MTFHSTKLSMMIAALGLVAPSAVSLAAERKPKKKKVPEVVANVVEAHDDHLVVITTKGKVVTKKLILNEQSKIIYVGFDRAKKEIGPKFTLRAKMNGDVITTVYVTPAVGDETVTPTPEMLKMTQAELFQLADANTNGRISYVEAARKIRKHAPKHGATLYYRMDKDKSGALEPQEFDAFLETVSWWKFSRKTPEETFKAADRDGNRTLSKEELALLLGTNAHIDILFKKADSNKSGDLNRAEVSTFINQKIYPSQINKE